MGKNDESDAEFEAAFKKWLKNNGQKIAKDELDLDSTVQNLMKSKLMESMKPKEKDNDAQLNRVLEAMERGNKTGMDPTIMMMMAMMMGNNNNTQQQPYPYPPWIFEQQKQNNGFDLSQIMQFKMVNQLLKDEGSNIDDFLKLQAALNSGKPSEVDKFIKYMQEKEKDDSKQEHKRDMQELRNEISRNLAMIQNPPQGTDPLSIIRQYQELKAGLDEIYKYASPEQQKQFPKEGEDWTADDVVSLAQKIIGTVPTLATAVGAVRGDRRARPPKKEMPETNRPLPTDHARGDLPDDIAGYFKAWRGPPNTSAIDPNGQRFENPDVPGTYYTKSEMLEYAKSNPEGMRQLMEASDRQKQANEALEREAQRKQQREEQRKAESARPPEPPMKEVEPIEPEPEEEELQYDFTDNGDTEQMAQNEEELVEDPEAIQEPENYGEEQGEGVENDGSEQ